MGQLDKIENPRAGVGHTRERLPSGDASESVTSSLRGSGIHLAGLGQEVLSSQHSLWD